MSTFSSITFGESTGESLGAWGKGCTKGNDSTFANPFSGGSQTDLWSNKSSGFGVSGESGFGTTRGTNEGGWGMTGADKLDGRKSSGSLFGSFSKSSFSGSDGTEENSFIGRANQKTWGFGGNSLFGSGEKKSSSSSVSTSGSLWGSFGSPEKATVNPFRGSSNVSNHISSCDREDGTSSTGSGTQSQWTSTPQFTPGANGAFTMTLNPCNPFSTRDDTPNTFFESSPAKSSNLFMSKRGDFTSNNTNGHNTGDNFWAVDAKSKPTQSNPFGQTETAGFRGLSQPAATSKSSPKSSEKNIFKPISTNESTITHGPARGSQWAQWSPVEARKHRNSHHDSNQKDDGLQSWESIVFGANSGPGIEGLRYEGTRFSRQPQSLLHRPSSPIFYRKRRVRAQETKEAILPLQASAARPPSEALRPPILSPDIQYR
ncbi:hypothetical protein AAMO2058_001488000 [Amorphochlora amoebiformis]